MFKNKEAIVNQDAFIPVFKLLYEMNDYFMVIVPPIYGNCTIDSRQ